MYTNKYIFMYTHICVSDNREDECFLQYNQKFYFYTGHERYAREFG